MYYILVIFIPWLVVTIWWYIGLLLYLLHKENLITTTNFGVKILTLGKDEKVLRRTVWCCQEKEPLIITRSHVSLPNSKVMPADFESKAKFKGQQLEWARKEYPYDYTLYLDEDSMCLFDKIPEGDIVQFREIPVSNNLLINIIEAHRIGFQIEQVLFEKTGPLYLWGGGFAVKRWLEDKVTWDRESITEDTGFVFSIREPYVFEYSKKPIYDQAPLKIRDLLRQRHRWASGTLQDVKYLKNPWRKAFIYFRTINWGLWIVYATLIPIVYALNPWLIVPFLVQTAIWSGVGAKLMKFNWWRSILTVLLAPLASYIHSFGALMAVFHPQKRFITTPKGVRLKAN